MNFYHICNSLLIDTIVSYLSIPDYCHLACSSRLLRHQVYKSRNYQLFVELSSKHFLYQDLTSRQSDIVIKLVNTHFSQIAYTATVFYKIVAYVAPLFFGPLPNEINVDYRLASALTDEKYFGYSKFFIDQRRKSRNYGLYLQKHWSVAVKYHGRGCYYIFDEITRIYRKGQSQGLDFLELLLPCFIYDRIDITRALYKYYQNDINSENTLILSFILGCHNPMHLNFIAETFPEYFDPLLVLLNACKFGDLLSIERLIIKYGVNIRANKDQAFLLAAKEGQAQVCYYLKEKCLAYQVGLKNKRENRDFKYKRLNRNLYLEYRID